MDDLEIFLPKMIMALVGLVILSIFIYDFMLKREGFDPSQPFDPAENTYDPDKDVSYNSSAFVDQSAHPYIADDTYYSLNNATVYSNSNYVPTYEDTIYLTRSRMIRNSQPVVDSNDALAGFCSFTENSLSETEAICNTINRDVCASTKCCVLLGGEKCVAGSRMGPAMISNYNDPDITNKDHYFYNGKCFGNCI